MKILALSREAAEDFIYNHLDRKIGVISIIDPGNKHPGIVDKTYAWIKLQFHDVEDNYPSNTRSVIKFDKEMAEDIIWCVKQKTKLDYLVVHCEAGISRSAATAAAISRILGLDQSIFFKYPFLPNKLVYQTIMKTHLGTDKDVDMPIVEAMANESPSDYFGA